MIFVIMFNVFNLDTSRNGITYWNSYQGVRSQLLTRCIWVTIYARWPGLYWAGYKKVSARWETICDHDISASRRTGNDWASRSTDWLTISDSSNLILRARWPGHTLCPTLPPPAYSRETETLNNTQPSVIRHKSVLQSTSFNISINSLLPVPARWEERESLTDTNSPTDVGIFIRTNNVALWIFLKICFKNIPQIVIVA